MWRAAPHLHRSRLPDDIQAGGGGRNYFFRTIGGISLEGVSASMKTQSEADFEKQFKHYLELEVQREEWKRQRALAEA